MADVPERMLGELTADGKPVHVTTRDGSKEPVEYVVTAFALRFSRFSNDLHDFLFEIHFKFCQSSQVRKD